MSKPVTHFLNDTYERDLNFMSHYIEEQAFGISRMNGISLPEAEAFVKATIGDETVVQRIDPRVRYIGRDDNQDRIKCQTTMTEYFRHVSETKRILSATLVTIKSHDEQPSVCANVITGKKAKRYKAKAEAFAYDAAGDTFRRGIKDAEQNNLKRSNNGFSGSQSALYNIFSIASGHPILTSTTRISVSSANSSNERFLAGSRPYYTADHVLEDINHICCKSDHDYVVDAIRLFNLHIPSIEEVMEMIQYSTKLYWVSEGYDKYIYKLVSGLTDIERAMVMYNGDFYHLTKYNPELTRSIFDSIIKIDYNNSIEARDNFGSDDAMMIFAMASLADQIGSRKPRDLKKDDPELYLKLSTTYHHADDVMASYIPLIKAFWVTRVMPRDIGKFPTAYRKVGLLSDTDSVVATAQFYIDWYFGDKVRYGSSVWSLTAFITYLVSSLILHYLAQISTNFGANEEYRYLFTMKNEFLFGILGLTGRGKHYYSIALQQEGNVPKGGHKWEVKGSALLASKVSDYITGRSHGMLKEVILKKMRNEEVYANDVINDVISLENEIEREILAGNSAFLKMETINALSGYRTAKPHQYFNYLFWQHVYGATHGNIDNLPYNGVRLSLTCDTQAKTKAWIESIEDPVIRDKITEIMSREGKKYIASIVLPISNIVSTGIPKEFIPVIDMKLMIAKLMSSYYLVLDSYGLYISRNNNGKQIINIRNRVGVKETDESVSPYVV